MPVFINPARARDLSYAVAGLRQYTFDYNTHRASPRGWPSFFKATRKNSVIYKVDNSHGMTRAEVTCARCASHLGHIFDEGPPPTHKRFCMNSVSLDFQPDNAVK